MMREKPPKVDKIETLALRLLSIRDHSRAEIIGKLKLRGYSEREIEPSIARLQAEGLISDARYAERLARRWAETKYCGNQQIQQKLALKGISEDLAQKAISRAEETLATPQRIQRLLQRKLKGRKEKMLPPGEKQKLAQGLLRKGFLWDDIGEMLEKIGGFRQE